MIYFCTLLDSAYLSRGLAMYESLLAHEPKAVLCFFCFDQKSYEVLKQLNLKQAQIVGLHEFENERLLAIKPGRNRGEYCWTCKASAIEYVLDRFSAESCTYVDADLYFFASPSLLIDEMKDASVLLTPHRFTSQYDSSHLNGKYCAQYLTFKNTPQGRQVLSWWNNACIEWCYARHEENKYGDQKYLEQMEQFPGVMASSHLGTIGPWNVQQYEMFLRNKQLFGKETATGVDFEVVFFHFHSFKFLPGAKKASLGSYFLPKAALNFIYQPFAKDLLRINKKLQSEFALDSVDEMKTPLSWKSPIRFIKRKLQGFPRIVSVRKLIEAR
ncbi:MAG: glycosyl transferase [Gammaproteobacteria bacterium]|jgi:hypothetical protein|nr:glycosyl transferase [Gammaproteobacteria bacterium]